MLHLHGRKEHQGPNQLRQGTGVALTTKWRSPFERWELRGPLCVSVAPARILCMQDPDLLCTIPESTWLKGDVLFKFSRLSWSILDYTSNELSSFISLSSLFLQFDLYFYLFIQFYFLWWSSAPPWLALGYYFPIDSSETRLGHKKEWRLSKLCGLWLNISMPVTPYYVWGTDNGFC